MCIRDSFYGVTEEVGAAAVLDAARTAGIAAMWSAGTPTAAPNRYELVGRASSTLVPEPFSTDIALGAYPITVLDQAVAMATFAARGQRGPAHFVRSVIKDFAPYYTEPASESALDPQVVADVTWVLRQNEVGQLLDGPEVASISGTKLIADSALEASHAWHVGYTTGLAMAVWIGNQEMEFPLRDRVGDRITGETLPADAFRVVIGEATRLLDLPQGEFDEPANIGDPDAGDA